MRQFLKDEYGEKMLALPNKRALLFQVAEFFNHELNLPVAVINTLDPFNGESRLGVHLLPSETSMINEQLLSRAREIWRKFL